MRWLNRREPRPRCKLVRSREGLAARSRPVLPKHRSLAVRHSPGARVVHRRRNLLAVKVGMRRKGKRCSGPLW